VSSLPFVLLRAEACTVRYRHHRHLCPLYRLRGASIHSVGDKDETKLIPSPSYHRPLLLLSRPFTASDMVYSNIIIKIVGPRHWLCASVFA
jgi:hypothetical protein